MSTTAFKKGLDICEGDIIQVTSGDYAGRVGEVISVHCKNHSFYCVIKLSDIEGITVSMNRLKLVRSAV